MGRMKEAMMNANHLGQESSLDELDGYSILKNEVVKAINKLELAQHSQTTAPHGRLLAWEALCILREVMK